MNLHAVLLQVHHTLNLISAVLYVFKKEQKIE